jgi:hypothetical protein
MTKSSDTNLLLFIICELININKSRILFAFQPGVCTQSVCTFWGLSSDYYSAGAKIAFIFVLKSRGDDDVEVVVVEIVVFGVVLPFD